MISRYRVVAPIRAILDKLDGERVPVTLPAGAVLCESSLPASTLLGMVGVVWAGRHYSIYPKDLYKKAERVSTA
jgi:hypothetical protein